MIRLHNRKLGIIPRFVLVVMLYFAIHAPLLAAGDNYLFGGRTAGMANAAVSLYDFWAVSHNQAGLARLESTTAGVYFENKFLLDALSFGAAAVAYPTSSGVLAFSFTHFGFDLYSENKVGLGFARDFSDRFSAGVQLNYHHSRLAEDYGSSGNVTFELGAIFEILPDLHIGAHLFNPARAKVADYANERIPTILRTGFSYTFSEKVIVVLEAEQSTEQKATFKAGFDYQIVDHFSIRGGVGTHPTSNAFGFGFRMGKLQIDLASSYHYVLGYSPQASLVYEL